MGVKKIVYAALVGNGLIALSKFVIGVMSGSIALLAEAAHSVADTFNQIFLLISLKLSKRPADQKHPFGYGKERFFWAFVTAVMLFVVGAFFSIYEGIKKIIGGEAVSPSHFFWIYLALGIAFIFEVISLGIAVGEVKHLVREKGKPFFEVLGVSKDTTTKTVLAEDFVALLGIIIAGLGTYLVQITRSTFFDGAASLVIGFLLLAVAIILAQQSRGLLLGESASKEDRKKIRETILSHPRVEEIVDLLTMHLGPEEILVTSHLSFRDGLNTVEIAQVIDEIETKVAQDLPQATQIFIEAERGRE